ncbi:hypothetical protein BDW59DRAFT_141756 [Aspergillus cavernicola]|uniref:Uncharacterized protein n=1 Tax=Aspergillus cavernicola TaxID=176166 RepID=A0ABR4IPI2_9EURO
MAWYSILPADLIYLESWVVRCFLFLGLVTILPWVALIIFDMALYIWRLVAYEVPVVGGRARGEQRPRAPSLNEIPEMFGLGGYDENNREKDRNIRGGGGTEGLKRRPVGGRGSSGSGCDI